MVVFGVMCRKKAGFQVFNTQYGWRRSKDERRKKDDKNLHFRYANFFKLSISLLKRKKNKNGNIQKGG